MSANANALAIYQKVSDPIAKSKEMARSVASVVPNTTESQGEAIALVCMCEGIHAIDFARRYHWIPGKGPSMRADAMLGEFEMNEGGKYRRIEKSPTRAAIYFKTKDGDEYTLELTRRQMLLSRWPWASNDKDKKMLGWRAANARVVELLAEGKTEDQVFYELQPHFKDNWGTEADWQNMLYARLASDSLRSICAKLVAGVYTPEEMGDLEVLSTSVSTNAPAPPTAAEVLRSPVTQSTQPADAVVNIDAAGVQVQQTQQVEEAPFEDAEFTAKPTEATNAANSGNGVTRAQLDKLISLREQMQLPDTDWNAALAKRNVQAAHSLTKDQAAELIDKMEARIKAAAGN